MLYISVERLLKIMRYLKIQLYLGLEQSKCLHVALLFASCYLFKNPSLCARTCQLTVANF